MCVLKKRNLPLNPTLIRKYLYQQLVLYVYFLLILQIMLRPYQRQRSYLLQCLLKVINWHSLKKKKKIAEEGILSCIFFRQNIGCFFAIYARKYNTIFFFKERITMISSKTTRTTLAYRRESCWKSKHIGTPSRKNNVTWRKAEPGRQRGRRH